MKELKVSIDIRPRAWQSVRASISNDRNKTVRFRKRKVKLIFRKPKWVEAYKSKIIYQIRSKVGPVKLIGKVRVVSLIYNYKTARKKLHGEYKETHPDLMDNMNKPLFDALTKGGFIEDDRYIVESLLTRKAWGDADRIDLHLQEIEGTSQIKGKIYPGEPGLP